MNSNDPQFWMMISSIVIAVCFIIMAIALIAIAVIVRRAVKTVSRLEGKFDPLLVKVNAMSVQGKEISVHLNEVSANLSTATRHLAESTELIKEEVAELKMLVGETAIPPADDTGTISPFQQRLGEIRHHRRFSRAPRRDVSQADDRHTDRDALFPTVIESPIPGTDGSPVSPRRSGTSGPQTGRH